MTDKELVVFKGLSMSARVYPGQEIAPHPDKIKQGKANPDDRAHSITVECSQDLYNKLKKMKLSAMIALKEFEDQPGKTYIKIPRTKLKYWTDPKTNESKTIDFGNPEVTDANGVSLTIDTLIGNGSTVEVQAYLLSYPNSPSRGLSLKSVKVLNLVPYIKPEVHEEVVLEETSSTSSFF